MIENEGNGCLEKLIASHFDNKRRQIDKIYQSQNLGNCSRKEPWGSVMFKNETN